MTWNVDPSHTTLEFAVRHLGIATVKGSFHRLSGSLEYDQQDPTRSRGTLEVELASVDTRDEKRDGHLRSADFFDVEQYPKAVFAVKSISPVDRVRYAVTGDLTLHGVTREVELRAEVGAPITDPWGNTRMGLAVEGELNRVDFGLTWNQVLEAGRMLVGEKVKISAEAELVQAAAAAAA